MLSWFRKQAPIEVQEAAQTGIELVAESPLEHEHESEKREDETELEDGDDEDYDDEEDEDYEEEDEREQIAERIFAWGEEWSKTPGFEALTQEQKDESEFIVGTFTDYMYTYHDCPPEEWDTESMQSCCLNTLPRKISAEEVYFRSVAPVLTSFFTFLGKTGRLRNSSRMAARILQLSHRIVAASKDSRNWGFAKAFAMSAMEAGVDLNDETAMNAFTARYNEQITGQPLPMAGASLPDYVPEPDELDWDEVDRMPYEREGPKIGRNDPCPCGSGKKYKKCCGSS